MSNMYIKVDITLKGTPPGCTKEITHVLKPWIWSRSVSNWPAYMKKLLGFGASDMVTMLKEGIEEFHTLKDPPKKLKAPASKNDKCASKKVLVEAPKQ